MDWEWFRQENCAQLGVALRYSAVEANKNEELVQLVYPDGCRPCKAIGVDFIHLDIEKPLTGLCERDLEVLPLASVCRELHDG